MSLKTPETPIASTGDIIRCGVLKKAKTSRKKYFVLRAETPDALARLEYYDSEKKYRAGQLPRRIIPLKTCFNINRKPDSKHKHVIGLYTKTYCFCVAFESEDELKVWLKDFLTLQHGEEIPEGEVLKPKFEFVWQVSMCNRGLGEGRTGLYQLCLTERTLTMLKIDEPIPQLIEIFLTNVRTCGNLKNFFYLEVGRSSEIGPGEIWFDAFDTNIAMNIQTTVTHRFRLAREVMQSGTGGNTADFWDFPPKGRLRSASATEPSKGATKKFNLFTSSKQLPQESSTSESTVTPPVTSAPGSSMSTVSGVALSIYKHFLQKGPGKRRHSISGGGTGLTSGANHQRTQSLPVATPFGAAAPPVAISTTDNTTTSITLINHSASIKKLQGAVGGGKCSFRERCDSMPSRPRTTSEGNHANPNWKPYAVPFRSHLRDASHSPPAGNTVSPPSESTGSSYSLADEHDAVHEMEHPRMYTSMNSDEPIAEEDYPESPRPNAPEGNYLSMTPQGLPKSNSYMPMSFGGQQHPSTPGSDYVDVYSASTSSVTSGTPVGEGPRHPDYHLEKVMSYVSAEGDDTRPGRAYSLGSKPPDTQLTTTPENRQRACSVGSKTYKKYFNRVLQTHHAPGAKSNSAPLLVPNSHIGSSQGSISNNPLDDLMWMDFTNNGSNRSRSSTNGSSSSCNHKNSICNGTKAKLLGFLENWGVMRSSDREHKKSTSSDGHSESKYGAARTVSGSSDSPYMDVAATQRLRPDIDVDVSNLTRSNAPFLENAGNGRGIPLVGHPFSPYVDMRHGSNSNRPGRYEDAPYLDMSGNPNNAVASGEEYMDMSGSSPNRGLDDCGRTIRRTDSQDSHRHDYLDMSQRIRANSNSSANSRTATSSGVSTDHNTDYLDMSGRNRRTNSVSSQISTSPHFDNVSPRYSEHLPFEVTTIPEGRSTDTDGYVEMTPEELRAVGHERQNSTDSTDNDHGDYLNMSGMNTALTATKETKPRSEPIAIQTKTSTTPLTISLLLGRKPSPPARTSAKMHLPISPYSSLPRQKSPRKGSASQPSSSKNSSVNSSVTTTPSSSSAMFPMSLNSPQSPLADISNAGTPTAASMRIPTSGLGKNTGAKKKNTEDYTMMDFESSNKQPFNADEESLYVNYCPPGSNGPSRVPRLHSHEADEYSGDYAVMRPGAFSAKPATLPRVKQGGSSGLASPLANHLSSVGLNDTRQMCFMPIREKEERMPSPKPGDVPEKLTQVSVEKALETANMECEDNSCRTYDRLRSPTDKPVTKLQRPHSSNSNSVINPSTQRPASTTGTEKATTSRPSSVCSDGLTSKLGSSSSVLSSGSSTSTLVGEAPEPQQVVRLHYASLDLKTDPSDKRSPRTSNENSGNDGQNATFVYADIDFIRSEELRSANNGGTSSNKNTSAVVN